MAEVELGAALDQIILAVDEGMPAEVEEAALADHQLNPTVGDALVYQLWGPQKAVFREGLSMALISTAGLLNPPITAPLNTSHGSVLLGTFHFLVFVSVAIGVVLMLLSTVLHRKPSWIVVIEKPLKKIGWISVKITLGYGSALALMLSSPTWFAFCLLFIIAVGEGMPAEVEEAALADHQLNPTVEDALVYQLWGPQKAVFREGLSMALISTAGLLNPPITAPLNTSHGSVLLGTFHFLVFVSVAIGVVLMLLSTVLHRKPSWIVVIEKPLKKIGWISVKITLGYGSALALMLSSPTWFAFCLLFIIAVGEGMPAEVEEAALADHQLNPTVEDALVDQLWGPQKAVFREGLSMALISTAGLLNPPITAPLNTAHGSVLLGTFHFLVFVSVAIGVVLMLLSTVLHRKPSWIVVIAKPLKKMGWISVKITLGYGSALVLMLSSPTWFAFCLLFIYMGFT